MYTGPHIKRDGLVFGYDTGYGVSDNTTGTRLYKGIPTTNLNADPYHSTRSAGDTITLTGWGGDTGQGSFEVNTSPAGGGLMFINHNTSNPAGSGGTYTDFPATRYTLTNGVTYTRSWWAKSDDVRTASAHICSCNRDSTNTYIIGPTVSLNTTWQRYSSTFTYTGPTSSDWQFRHINYDKSKIYIANVQLEVGSVASPFVNGTRSNTGSLIDLKRNTDIDLSYVSFDSTGQPTFDGTDDEIELAANDWNKVSAVTIEAIVSINGAPIDGNDYHVVVQKDGAYSGGAVYGIRINNSSVPYGTFSRGSSSSDTHVNTVAGNTMTSNKYYHLVYTRKIGESVFYQNGVQETINTSNNDAIYNNTDTVTIGQGDGRQLYGDIPIVKIYNRVLSAEEVKQNFNAYKNRFGI
jgi:hypothetical protein